MASKGNTRIARDARLTAEADFATWLMMAKLGSFGDLPNEAQTFLSQYQERLKTAGEKDAAAATIDEIYAAYYAQRGGKGAPPPVDAPEPALPSEFGQHRAAAGRPPRPGRPRGPAGGQAKGPAQDARAADFHRSRRHRGGDQVPDRRHRPIARRTHFSGITF